MNAPTDHANRIHVLALAAICLTCIGIYANSVNVPLVFDDRTSIQNNRHIQIRDLSPASLYRAGFESISPRPIANISFALNYYHSQYDVTGYHIVNIVVHTLVGMLVYGLALFVFRHGSKPSGTNPVWMALFAALVFCAHPIQTQAVTYIVQRMTSLATLFYLLSLLFYIYGRQRGPSRERRLAWAGCALAWALALGSKQIAVTLPLSILLIESYYFRNLDRSWLRKSLWLSTGGALVILAIGYAYMGSFRFEGYEIRDYTMWERVLTQPRVVCFYISLLVFPLPDRFNLIHSFSLSHSLVDPVSTLLCVFSLLALVGLGIACARKEPLLSFSILWFFLHLALESSILPLAMAFEHRLYLPMVGVALAISQLVFRARPGHTAQTLTLAILILAVLAGGSIAKNQDWRDKVTLWQNTVRKAPEDRRARYNLAMSLLEVDRAEESVPQFEKAIEIDPNFSAAHNGMAMALVAEGQLDQAIFHYSEALRIGAFGSGAGLASDEAITHTNLALSLDQRGDTAEAIEHFSTAIQIDPDYASAHLGLGILLARQRQLEQAVGHLAAAVRLEPDNSAARSNLASTLLFLGRLDEATAQYEESLRLNSEDAWAHFGLGFVHSKRGNQREALRHFDAALLADPERADVRKARERLLRVMEK